MIGKIKFYNEAKGFGQIVDEDKNEYFFHISKVLNTPEKIYPNDKVEFVGFETSKGLNAKDITFKAKINCHVCNWTNTDDEQNCINPKCGFTLKYAKGYRVGVSDEEVRQYKKELEKAKNNYKKKQVKNSDETKSNNKPNIKIIKGKIIFFDELKGFGFIRGGDGKKYYFHISNTDKPLEITNGLFIIFIECSGAKGLYADDILIDYEANLNSYNDYSNNDDDYDDDRCYVCGNYSCTCYDEDEDDSYSRQPLGTCGEYWGEDDRIHSSYDDEIIKWEYYGERCPQCRGNNTWVKTENSITDTFVLCKTCGNNGYLFE